MVNRTRKYLVLLAFGPMALGLFLLAGCNRGESEKPTEVKSDPPGVYMKDPAFRKALDDAQVELKKLLDIEARLATELKLMHERVKSTLANADKSAIEEELKKNPEWTISVEKLKDIKKAIAERREKTIDVVRQRIAPKKVSK